MSQRVTIMMDNKIHEKILKVQTELILKEHNPVSFSAAVDATLRKGLKK